MIKKDLNKSIISYLKKYNVDRIGIFGSYARNQNRKNSDLDLLIRFRKNPTLLQMVRIERELSEILGIKVDIVTEPSLTDKALKKNIERDLQIIF
jgi:predicted nucleotidyltransferase